VTRLARFDYRITAALGQTERIDGFRDVIAHYVRNHDVPEVDVAAALAVVAQGESPLLLEPEPEQQRRGFEDRADRGDRPGRFDRDERPERRQRPSNSRLATYRIAVGKRHRVEPRQIVGALANEGGLSRGDFGAIQIRPDFSLVELPADLSQATLDRLSDTRISGKLIEIRLDTGGPGRRAGGDDRPPRKPRHKD
jgi:ATP-dependent RNA helicase DeaD